MPPVTFIYGAEEFLIERALNSILDKYYPNRDKDYNFNKYSSDEIEMKDLIDLANSFSMLGDGQVIVIKNFEEYFKGRAKKNDPNLKILLNYLSNPSDTTTLIITCTKDQLVKGKSKKFSEPWDTLINNAYPISYAKVYPNKFPEWLKNEFSKSGKRITEKAVYLILSQTQQTLRDLHNQVDKILNYLGDDDEISDEKIVDLIGQSRDYNVFELQKAVAMRDIKNSMDITENILKSSQQELYIIAVLAGFFKSVLEYPEAARKSANKYQIASEIGVNAFFLNDYKVAANRYSLTDLENNFIYLCEADQKLKTSSGSSIMIIQEMIYKILGKNER